MIQISTKTLAERYAQGKRLRKKVEREKHAELYGSADRDATQILAATDRTRVPKLVPIRYQRMLANPFAFPRGAAARRDSSPGRRRLLSDELRRLCDPRTEHRVRHQ